jgi:MFS family permease
MYGLCMIALLTWIPSFFQRTHGLEMGVIGTWLAFTKAVPHAAGTLLAGFLADRLARRGLRGPIFLCVFAQLVATPFYSVVLLWPDPTGAFLWLVIPSMVGVMQGPVLYATIQAVARVETRAVAAAIMILIINLASGVLGPLLVGLASDLSTASFGADALGYALLGGGDHLRVPFRAALLSGVAGHRARSRPRQCRSGGRPRKGIGAVQSVSVSQLGLRPSLDAAKPSRA